MEKFEKINWLLDKYGVLLTDRQKEIMELYYYENLSLTEIANNLAISRGGVHSAIQKASKLLFEYEDKLLIVANTIKILKAIEENNEFTLTTIYKIVKGDE